MKPLIIAAALLCVAGCNDDASTQRALDSAIKLGWDCRDIRISLQACIALVSDAPTGASLPKPDMPEPPK
jgi:hypothetical protein